MIDMRQLMKINLREVQLSKSRPSIPGTINALAESMREIGLINPVIVKAAPIFDGAIMIQGYKVVAGNHRVAAARALGWTEIDAFVHDGDELQAELAEIDENLQRAEFTPAQRAAAIKRRKEIWEVLHPTVGGTTCPTNEDPDLRRDGRRKGPQHEKDFAADTESKTGEWKRDINRHVARAEALGSDIHEVVGTSLDKGVELDALKDMPEPARKELIQRAKSGEVVSAREPAKPMDKKIAELVKIAREIGDRWSLDVFADRCVTSVPKDVLPVLRAAAGAKPVRKAA